MTTLQPTIQPTIQPTTAATLPRRNMARIFLTEARFEFLKLLRLPIYAVSVLAFPVMFYVIFGATFGGQQAQGMLVSKYMVATFAAAGILSASLFAFGAGVASERGQGWLRLKRVSPMPPAAYFFAKIAMATLFGALVVILVTGAAMGLQGVRIGFGSWLGLLAVLLTGVLPFSALGLAFGFLFGPNSAPMVLNLLYMPMAFASGLWIPIQAMPDVVQRIAVYLPSYHYAQLALGTIGAAPRADAMTHAAVLAAFTVAFFFLALWAYRRDEGRTYG